MSFGGLLPERITAPRFWWDSTDHIDMLDSTPRTLANEPKENIENADPTEPIERNEPTLPMERYDPVLPIDSADLCEAMLS